MRSVIVCLLLIVTARSSAQISILCPKLTDSTLNYFYIGVDNPINIIGLKNPQNYVVTISGGGSAITKVSSDEYLVRVSSVTDSCRLRLLDGKGKIVFKKDCKVRTIPDPDVRLAGIDDSVINKNHILENPSVIANRDGFYLKDYYQVISFDMTFETERSVIYTSAISNQLTEEQIELIKNMKSGMMVTVENIRARAWDGRTRKLVPIWFKIE